MTVQEKTKQSAYERAFAQLNGENDNAVLIPEEVAAVFRVDTKTVTRWAADGKINSFKTAGGHRRFYVRDVKKAMNDNASDLTNDDAVLYEKAALMCARQLRQIKPAEGSINRFTLHGIPVTMNTLLAMADILTLDKDVPTR